ncbi:hypothetical protein HDU67_005478 [Dinochytrium kinnereticum]|nr:hypothetical protein HDU67_005478 [Dinochytrium kinnereticum]
MSTHTGDKIATEKTIRKTYPIADKVKIAREALVKGRSTTARKYGLDGAMVGRWMRSIDLLTSAPEQGSRRRLPDGVAMIRGGIEVEGDLHWLQRAQWAIDHKTKPPRSLGFLETWSTQLMVIQKTLSPRLMKGTILLFAADHGVADEDVSQYPKSVTAEMLKNLNQGGAAINAICLSNGLGLQVVDVGVDTPDVLEKVRRRKPPGCRGSRSILHIDGALPEEYFRAALEAGKEMALDTLRRMQTATSSEFEFAIGLGELGIGNTTIAAALLLAVIRYRGRPGTAEEVAGKGTGVTDERMARKIDVIERAVGLHQTPCLSTVDMDPAQRWMEVLRRLGGQDVVAMAAAATEIAKASCALIIDGFISTVAYMMALLIFPEAIPALQRCAFFAHKSMEKGATIVYREIEVILQLPPGSIQPALDMGLRLGEG